MGIKLEQIVTLNYLSIYQGTLKESFRIIRLQLVSKIIMIDANDCFISKGQLKNQIDSIQNYSDV